MKQAPCQNCMRLTVEMGDKNRRIHELEAHNALLNYDLNEMRQKYGGRRKDREDTTDKKKPKKRGAPVGHPGWHRKKPHHIDVTEEVTLTRCPHCRGRELSEMKHVDEHIQEDIILPQLKVTKYRHHHYWCKTCKREIWGVGTEEMRKSYIGPVAKAMAAFLKWEVKISGRDIKNIFERLCGLTIVPSSIPGFHNQARRKALGHYEALKKQIQKEPYLHADETGCPVDGKNRWDWVFASAKLCVHLVHQSRGSKVVEEVLGQKYDGILISDFLAVYNKLEAKAKQKCLVHLLRELKKVLACTEDKDSVHVWCTYLKNLIHKAIDLSKKFKAKEISSKDYQRQREGLKDALKDVQISDSGKGIVNRLSKRVVRHQNELFTFLDHPEIPCHNNPAEQLIRPSVILRKITYGHRSDNGVHNHNVLMSILQTAKLNHVDRIRLIKKILLSRRKLPLKLILRN